MAKKNGPQGRKSAFAAAMKKAEGAKQTEQNTVPLAVKCVFEKSVGRKPNTPAEQIVSFLANYPDQKNVSRSLQGLKLSKIMAVMAKNAPLQAHQEAQLSEVAQVHGWKPAEARAS